MEDGDCGTLLPLTDVEYVEDTSEKAAVAAIGGGGGRADDGLKLVGEVVSGTGLEIRSRESGLSERNRFISSSQKSKTGDCCKRKCV